MTLQIEFTWLVGLLLTFFGAAAGIGKLLLSQHQRHQDRRFNELERGNHKLQTDLAKRLDSIETASHSQAERVHQLERDLLRFQAELPMQYVRREDYIRGQSTIEAKLDSLAGKLEIYQLRAVAHGGQTNAD
ncbi:hypothetical protein CK623_02880 [Vandammella animalimorsus]|uniref:Uncharacterized protein n=1 Tax=Vandammella animalimorsus TaxID=2029117 RepID=A0A2A2ATZ6_9BURK|nr:hypothetical protein [Vandammella animalimorsus]PAT41201.1 hypothetical protein CK623_02880 [Vandammella animalimorsus]RMX18891.1 hypothetical protein EBQ34_00575 [Vandammella animalimorsus]